MAEKILFTNDLNWESKDGSSLWIPYIAIISINDKYGEDSDGGRSTKILEIESLDYDYPDNTTAEDHKEIDELILNEVNNSETEFYFY